MPTNHRELLIQFFRSQEVIIDEFSSNRKAELAGLHKWLEGYCHNNDVLLPSPKELRGF